MADSFIVVDTDILIDVSRGISQAVDKLEHLELITKNQKDFKFIKGLKLAEYSV